MHAVRHLGVAILLVAVFLSGAAVAGIGPLEPGPHAQDPGWEGEGHDLFGIQNVSIGAEMTARVAASAPTEDGGRIVVGHRRYSLRAFTDDRVATAWRLGPDGEIQWEVDLAQNESIARDIVPTTDGFVVAGERGGEVFLVQLGTDGSVTNRVSVDKAGPARVGGLAPTDDGGVVLVGFVNQGAPDRAFAQVEGGVEDGSGWAVRTDASGEITWSRSFDAVARTVIRDGDAFVVAGRTRVGGEQNSTVRPWLQRFRGPEAVSWNRTWAMNDSVISTVAPTEDGFVVGGRLSIFDADARDYVWAAAVFGATEDGQQRWSRVLTQRGGGRVTDARQRSDGSVIMAATVDTDQATNPAVLTADGSGVTGATVFGSSAFDSASAVWEQANGSLTVTGDVERGDEADRRDILLVDLAVTGVATEVVPATDAPRSRGDVTISPTTTRPDVVYGENVTSTEETGSTPTNGGDPVATDPDEGGLPLLGIAVYLLPFAVVAAVVVFVRRRLR